MDRRRRQRGFLLIVAIVLVVVASMLAVTIAFIASTSGTSATDNLQSGQALFLADSGLEFEARRMAQNLDWYRSSTDPTTTSGAQALGAGTFTTSSNLPATKLRRRVVAASTVVCVYTVDRFPNTGTNYIQIDDDVSTTAEFVSYTGTTPSSAACPGNLPAFTGIGRGASVGGVATVTQDHSRDDIAYPVTTLIDPLAVSATCVAPASTVGSAAPSARCVATPDSPRYLLAFAMTSGVKRPDSDSTMFMVALAEFLCSGRAQPRRVRWAFRSNVARANPIRTPSTQQTDP